jgi:glycerophosphoryl diester phosphodiesterase
MWKKSAGMVVAGWLLSALMFCLRAETMLIAHRGGNMGPENTIPNAQRAFDAGADAVEVDLRSTKDGFIVCLHDADLSRTTFGTGKVNDLTFSQISQYGPYKGWSNPAYFSEEIPTLHDFLVAVKARQRRVWLDLKETGLAPGIRAAVDATEFPENMITFITWGSELNLYNTMFPQAEIMQIAGGNGRDWSSAGLNSYKEQGVDGFFFWGSQQSVESIKWMHAHGMKVGVISAGPLDVAPMVRAGLDYLSTDYVLPCHLARIASSWDRFKDQRRAQREANKQESQWWWGSWYLPISQPQDALESIDVMEFVSGLNPGDASQAIPISVTADREFVYLEWPVKADGLSFSAIEPEISFNLGESWSVVRIKGVEPLPNGHWKWKIARPSMDVLYRLKATPLTERPKN